MRDNRPDAEIRLGAALNALETLEGDLADFESKISTADYPDGVKEGVRQGYDYITLARVGVERLYGRMKPDPAGWIETAGNRDYGREAIKPVVKYFGQALSCLAGANMKSFDAMPHEWEHRRQWDSIYENRMGSAEAAIGTAKRSFTVAAMLPRRGK